MIWSRLFGKRLAARLRNLPDVDRSVAEAMIAVERHRFVPWRHRHRAYQDASLPIGPAQSISQPTFIAKVISCATLRPADRVLEIGTGSGYTAAVLARLSREVISVERVASLTVRARKRLAHLDNVRVLRGDAWHAPGLDGTFDAILVMCGAPTVAPELVALLRDGGRLVIPVGERRRHAIVAKVVRITKHGTELVQEEMLPSEWNTLIGEDGWT